MDGEVMTVGLGDAESVGAGDGDYRGEWHAIRQYARRVTGPAASRLYVWFEPDLLPGYAWSFPLADGRVNLVPCTLVILPDAEGQESGDGRTIESLVKAMDAAPAEADQMVAIVPLKLASARTLARCASQMRSVSHAPRTVTP